MSFWTEVGNPAALASTIDFHFVNPEIEILNNAPSCVFIQANVVQIATGYK